MYIIVARVLNLELCSRVCLNEFLILSLSFKLINLRY